MQLLDFFRGAPADKVNLRGIDHAIVCTAVGGEKVALRTYSIGLKKVRTAPKFPRLPTMRHTYTVQ
jgi:hypothetical protein